MDKSIFDIFSNLMFWQERSLKLYFPEGRVVTNQWAAILLQEKSAL